MTTPGFHEEPDRLRGETRDRHRALASLMEELEAVDWYDQRIDATQDDELARILTHHRDEEKEHAAMLLEWLRRRDAVLDEQLRETLFTDGPILGEHGDGSGDASHDGDPKHGEEGHPRVVAGAGAGAHGRMLRALRIPHMYQRSRGAESPS